MVEMYLKNLGKYNFYKISNWKFGVLTHALNLKKKIEKLEVQNPKEKR